MKYNLYRVTPVGDQLTTIGKLVKLKIGKSAFILGDEASKVECLDNYGWITSAVKSIRRRGQVIEFDTLNSTYRLEPARDAMWLM